MPTPASFRLAMLAKLGEYLEDYPTAWDINNGLCEAFAQDVLEICGGETRDCYGLWLDEIPGFVGDGDHYVIYFAGKYYDAECPNGVDDWHDIPLIRNKDKTREEVLAERGVK
jgi:hypothetical protein